MSTRALRFGSMPYEQFRALIDGRVTIDGLPVDYTTPTLATETFERMISVTHPSPRLRNASQ